MTRTDAAVPTGTGEAVSQRVVVGSRRRAPRRGSRRAQHRGLTVLAFLSPALVLYVAFVAYPFVTSIRYSFYSWNGVGPLTDFVGLSNYVFALVSRSFAAQFWRAVLHNLYFFAMSMVLTLFIGIGLAYLLTILNDKSARKYQAIYLLPFVVPPVVIAYIWSSYLEPTFGVYSAIISTLHLGFLNFDFLGSTTLALPTIACITAWFGMGFPVLVFLAAMINVPGELLDAARVDGAGKLRVLFSVVLPIIRPTILTITTLNFIGAFGAFDIIYIMEGTQAGPNYSTDVLGTLFYRTAFGGFGTTAQGVGLATTLAVLGFLIVMGASAVFVYFQRRYALD